MWVRLLPACKAACFLAAYASHVVPLWAMWCREAGMDVSAMERLISLEPYKRREVHKLHFTQ